MVSIPMDYFIYLSCSWYFDSSYCELFEMLDSVDDFHYSIHTLSTHIARSPSYQGRMRYERIKEKMEESQALLLLGGVYPYYQDWISKEIMACKNEGDRPIIVVMRDANRRVSPIVRQYADRIVGWDSEQIIASIRELVTESI